MKPTDIQPIPDKQTFDRIMEIGALKTAVRTDGETPFMVIPNGCQVQSLATFFPLPRIAGNPAFLDAGSFADYVNRFKTADTLIFADVSESGAKFRAALDYHAPAPKLTPRRREHSAHFETLETPEWKTWMGNDREQMDQVAFATYLEDNAALFQEPSGAHLLELVQTLHGKSDVRFTSAVRLQNGGNRLLFDEDVSLKGASSNTVGGAMELPREILAGICPFQGSDRYGVRARLKYRIEGRKLALWYETIGVHKIIRDSILELTQKIAEKTGIVPLLGRI